MPLPKPPISPYGRIILIFQFRGKVFYSVFQLNILINAAAIVR